MNKRVPGVRSLTARVLSVSPPHRIVSLPVSFDFLQSRFDESELTFRKVRKVRNSGPDKSTSVSRASLDSFRTFGKADA